ncbi:MAG: hypothetical protein ACK47B_12895 [Armatimonadota bacterium]
MKGRVEALFDRIGRCVAETGGEAYFVGGCVRDLLRGVPIKDLDLALEGDTHAAGKRLANALRGHVFWLHQEERVVRVILPEHDGLHVDLSPLRGTLEQDLQARDLTINAMAVAAADGLHPGVPILDPTGGQRDLAAGLVRFVQETAPREDPLRVLRALRFRWLLDFQLTPETAALARECGPLLARVSVERVRDELFQVLALRSADRALRECLELGLSRWLFGAEVPEPERSADRVGTLLELLDAAPPAVSDLLDQPVTPPRRRRESLAWAAALQPHLPALDPAAAGRYLALSNDERHLIEKGLAAAPRLRELAARWPVSGRERYRAFRGGGRALPEAVLLAAAADGGWSAAYAELLEEALWRHQRPPEPLLTGQEVMQALKLRPGPQIGRLLEEIEEARADGMLRTRDEALAYLLERHGGTAPEPRSP